MTQEFKKSSDTNSELRQFPTYQESEVGISDAQLRHHQLLDELGAGGDGGADGEEEHGRLDRQRRQRRRQRQKRFQEKALHHRGQGIKVFRRQNRFSLKIKDEAKKNLFRSPTSFQFLAKKVRCILSKKN